jgi:uncharacterized protein YndB with AHSA1/START domain
MSQRLEPQNATGARAVREEIAIAAPPEAVWRALTEAEELTNWFPTQAGVEPGEGGKIWLAWEEQFRWDLNIEAWESGRHLRTTYTQEAPRAPDEASETATRPLKIAMDFYLEPRRGGTIVRVVHSGFGPEATWDNEYYGVLRGWRYELRSLQHYLERHPGVARRVAWARTAVKVSVESAWEALTGSDGLIVEGNLTGLDPDSPYFFRAATGHVFRGVVRTLSPPFEFSGTVENLGDSLLRLAVEPITGDPLVWIWLATYGLSQIQVDDLEDKFQKILGRVFGDSA